MNIKSILSIQVLTSRLLFSRPIPTSFFINIPSIFVSILVQEFVCFLNKQKLYDITNKKIKNKTYLELERESEMGKKRKVSFSLLKKLMRLSLLKLMEESERTLEMFWNNHFIRLNKCLDLRKFEQRFRDVRINLLGIYDRLDQINDENIGNVDEYDAFIHDLQLLNEQSKVEFLFSSSP